MTEDHTRSQALRRSFNNLNVWRLLNYLYCISFLKRSKSPDFSSISSVFCKPRGKSSGNNVVVWSRESNDFSCLDVFLRFCCVKAWKGPMLDARNVRLYYPYWQYTDLFVFRFVSLLCLRSTLRLSSWSLK